MKTTLILGIVAIIVIVLAAVVLLVLPAVTTSTAISYLLDYQGYSFARLTSIAEDGSPQLEATSSSFAPGEDVYIVIYGISGFKTQDGMAKLNMDIRTTAGSDLNMPAINQDFEYPAPSGYIDNVYGYIVKERLQSGRYSITLALRDSVGGGVVTVTGDFTVS